MHSRGVATRRWRGWSLAPGLFGLGSAQTLTAMTGLTRPGVSVTICGTIVPGRKIGLLPLLGLVTLAASVVASAITSETGHGGNRQILIGLVVTHDTPTSADGLLSRTFVEITKQVGVNGRVVYQPPNLDPRGALIELARERYNLIVAGTNVDPGVVRAVAVRFPTVRFDMTAFSHADLGGAAANVEGTVFRSEQASYLAGFLAARMESRRHGRHVISSVGGYPVPPVDALIAGFEAGARRGDARVVTLHAYAQSFNDVAKCRAVALGQIAAGAGVVFQVAGACGLGALEAAKQNGVWGIGVDVDQSRLGTFVLTSAVGRFDLALSQAIRSTINGTFKTGGDSVYDLKNGGVGLGKISPIVPRSLVQEVALIHSQIVAGKIKVPTTLR